MKVAVVGGGVAGLAAAYRLLQKGHQVSLFEAGPSLGGLVRTFEVGGGRIESFYHHLFASDTTIIRLINDLGLGDRLVWRDSKVGFFQDGRIYDFVTPLDLLRFRPLPLLDRVRLGLMGLRLRREERWDQFEDVTAHDWIVKNVSPRVFDVVWGPLLRGKFGEAGDEVSMAWLWSKIHLRFASRRSGPMQKEQLAYLLGSFGVYVDELGRRLREAGAEVRVGTPVQEVIVEGGRARGLLLAGGERVPADAVIAAMASHVFERLAPALPDDYRSKLTSVRWQWALCMVLALRESFSPIYWLNIAESGMPFLAVVEHTNFMGPEHYGGQHVLYISNYLRPDHPYFDLSEEQLWQVFLPALQRINPRFSDDWVKERWLFKGPHAQPIVTTGYRRLIPEHRTPIPGLYLATMNQIYPEDRGQNYSIMMGEKVADLAMEDQGRAELPGARAEHTVP
jgi:protoporphyrinogen oxidase